MIKLNTQTLTFSSTSVTLVFLLFGIRCHTFVWKMVYIGLAPLNTSSSNFVLTGRCRLVFYSGFDPAIRCYRCQRRGYHAKNCRGPERCKVSSGSHNYKGRISGLHPNSANCGGKHAPSYDGCITEQDATWGNMKQILDVPQPRRALKLLRIVSLNKQSTR